MGPSRGSIVRVFRTGPEHPVGDQAGPQFGATWERVDERWGWCGARLAQVSDCGVTLERVKLMWAGWCGLACPFGRFLDRPSLLALTVPVSVPFLCSTVPDEHL